MTLFKKFIGFIAFAAVVVACKKEMSSENNEGPSIIDAKWEFKEAGTLFQGDIDTAFISRQPGFVVLTIEGKSLDDRNGVLLMQIGADTVVAGTYTNSDLFFQYSENGTVIYESVPGDPNYAAFSINIGSIDSASISGTFSGPVVGSDNNQRTIADGKFTASLTGANTGPDTIPDPDTIPEPDPNLDYLPLGSVWTYGNLDPAAPIEDSVRIVSQGEVEFDGQTYTQFVNETTNQTRYFRKDTAAGIYYERVNPSDEFPIQEPVELIILQENPDPGFTWESSEFVIDYSNSGVPVTITAKLVSRISEYNATYDINGKIYNNVIEVISDLYAKDPDTEEWVNQGSLILTKFAKGVGIVHYYDASATAEYAIRNYIITP